MVAQFESDIEIARRQKLEPIETIGAKLGLTRDDLVLYGDYKAKVKMETVRKALASKKPDGKLVLVSAITPTPAGEGKTTCSIGLTQAIQALGKKACVALREPSMGPCFGRKGGAAGGGYSQVLPMEDINLHFTGDMHAISTSNNLISAVLDNYFHFADKWEIQPRRAFWRRVMDMNDRSLRYIVAGLGGLKNSIPRETGFDITPASEIMAILCLSKSYEELKEKIGNILLGLTQDGKPFTIRELNIHGAAAALLKEALMPNLVQTLEKAPALVHGGPFANIAQGANSILATKLALKSADYVVTEAGFGCDLGAEKFLNIVSRYGDFQPATVVIVATVGALKMHGGVAKNRLAYPSPEDVQKGGENLEKHIENIRKFGLEPVVAINRFPADTEEEFQVVQRICEENGAHSAVVNVRAEGGEGGIELAKRVVETADAYEGEYKPLYDWQLGVEDKIDAIAREIYGAQAVDFSNHAKEQLKTIQEHGYQDLPICMAKTQNSLSDNPRLLGRPEGFVVQIRDIVVSAGAGFLVPLAGEMMRMPGLPRVPAAEKIDIDDEGEISGLF